MQRGYVTSTTQGIRAGCKDLELKKYGAAFGDIIYDIVPPCIDCSWPLEHDDDIQRRLKELGLKCQPAYKPSKTYTVTTRNSGHHELDLDCPRSLCKAVSKDCKQRWSETSVTWVTQIDVGRSQALYGFEVIGKDITRVEIDCGGCLSWARSLDKVDKVQVDRPGNICWPLCLTVFYSTFLVIESETKPTDIRILLFDVDPNKVVRYRNGEVVGYDFDSEDAKRDGAIARFVRGLVGAATCRRDEKEYVQRLAAKMRESAAAANKTIDTSAETTITIDEY